MADLGEGVRLVVGRGEARELVRREFVRDARYPSVRFAIAARMPCGLCCEVSQRGSTLSIDLKIKRRNGSRPRFRVAASSIYGVFEVEPDRSVWMETQTTSRGVC